MRTFDYLRYLVSNTSANAQAILLKRCANCNDVVPISRLAVANAMDEFYLCKNCYESVRAKMASIEMQMLNRLRSLGFIAYYLFEIADTLTDEERIRLMRTYVAETRELLGKFHPISASAIISNWITVILSSLVRPNMVNMPQFAYEFSKMLKASGHGVSALRREPARKASQGQTRAQHRRSRPAGTP